MLNGKELGRAIEKAIDLKIESGAINSKADVARHFDIKAPSVHEWIKTGSISKDKLGKLWAYFSDVVGPDHWGLSNDMIEYHKAVNKNEALNKAKEKIGEYIKIDPKNITVDKLELFEMLSSMTEKETEQAKKIFEAITNRKTTKKRSNEKDS